MALAAVVVVALGSRVVLECSTVLVATMPPAVAAVVAAEALLLELTDPPAAAVLVVVVLLPTACSRRRAVGDEICAAAGHTSVADTSARHAQTRALVALWTRALVTTRRERVSPLCCCAWSCSAACPCLWGGRSPSSAGTPQIDSGPATRRMHRRPTAAAPGRSAIRQSSVLLHPQGQLEIILGSCVHHWFITFAQRVNF